MIAVVVNGPVWKAYLVAWPDVWAMGHTKEESVYYLVRMLGLLAEVRVPA